MRLIGIDTPETKHPSKPVQCIGPEASAKLVEILPVGSNVGLERDVQEFDRYQRTLAYVWTADGATMVNEQMVAEGYAVTLTIPPDVRHTERFVAAQQAARDAGAGLWSGCAEGSQETTDDAPVVEDQSSSPPPAETSPALPAPALTPEAKPVGNCHPSYPDFCMPPAPPDLDCASPEIRGRKNFTVRQPDAHTFDADKDGVGCESR